jgi:hypothetical protein
MPLEDRLHPHMVSRRDVVGGDKESAQVVREFGQGLNRFPQANIPA